MTQTMDMAAMTQNMAAQLPVRQDHSQQLPRANNPVVGNRGVIINSFDELWKMSSAISKSGLAPKGIQTPEAIFTAIQFGFEIGLSPMAALQSLAIVNGRPSIYGDAALALVRGSGLCEYYTEFESNNEVHAVAELLAAALEDGDTEEIKKCRRQIAVAKAKIHKDADDFGFTAISKRAGGINSVVRRFTIGDAKRAGLFGKDGPWKQYRDRMLMWRCRGFNLRDNFGDVLKGMYTAEEARDMMPAENGQRQTVSSDTRTESVLKKITSRPVSEGQSFEPTPEATAEANGEGAGTQGDLIEQTETTDPANVDIDHQQPEAPESSEPSQPEQSSLPEPPILLSHEHLVEALNSAAMSLQLPEAAVLAGLNEAVKGQQVKRLTPAARLGIWKDFVAGRGAFNR